MAKTVKINSGFICLNCGEHNPPAAKTCRNHCRRCLYSRHVDDAVPGDRASACRGLMSPAGLDQDGKKGFIILHKCLECGRENRNLTASDDNFDAIIQLSTGQNFHPRRQK